MRVADFMTEKPISIPLSTTVRGAARTLDQLAVRHLPVVNDEGELVGIVSDRDLRGTPGGAAAGDLLAAAPRASTPIVDVMSTDLVQAAADDDLATIMELMVEHRVGAVPIVDNQGLLVGIVSYVDVLRTLLEELSEAGEAPKPRKNHAGKPIFQRAAAPAKRKPPAAKRAAPPVKRAAPPVKRAAPPVKRAAPPVKRAAPPVKRKARSR